MESYLSSQRLCEKDAINSRWGHAAAGSWSGSLFVVQMPALPLQSFCDLDGCLRLWASVSSQIHWKDITSVCVLWKQGNREKA